MNPKSWPRRAFRLPWRTASEIDSELDEEFAFHIEQRTARLIADGMEPAAARRESLRRFGDLADARSYCRAADRGQARIEQRRDWITGWRQDFTFAVRQLLRAPSFTLIAIVTLALGVGANTAIFSVVHRVLLNPLPYADGDRMVSLLERSQSNQLTMTPEKRMVDAWTTQSKKLEAIEQYDEKEVSLKLNGDVLHFQAGEIRATLPAFLGITPPLGRSFLPEETTGSGAPVVMLGWGLWQRQFGGRRDVLGSSITVDGRTRTVVGVMPRDVILPSFSSSAKQLWLPFTESPIRPRLQALGKLTIGATPQQASAELTAIEHAVQLVANSTAKPDRMQFDAAAVGPNELMSSSTRSILLLLFAVVGVVLLIACANVANLLLARAAARSREFAIRTALGAGRARLVRQLLTESLLLALLGGALGVFLAARGLDLLVAMRPESMRELDEVHLQPIALLWSLGLSIGTGLLFGLAPILFATDRTMGDTLKSSAGAGAHRTPRRLRAVLVVGEVAMSVMLLVGAGLLIRTVREMQQVQVGFNPVNLTDIGIKFADPPDVTAEERAALAEKIIAGVRALPGIEKAMFTNNVPPKGGVAFGDLEIEGKALSENEKTSLLGFTMAAPEFFDVMGLGFQKGAPPGAKDTRTVVINSTMAKRYWPGENAVGKRYRMDKDGDWLTVSGIANDIHIPGREAGYGSLQTYFPLAASDIREQFELVIRTRGDRAAILRQVQQLIDGYGLRVQISRVATVESMLDDVVAGPRFNMALFVAFAGLALVLAMIGLYGVISFSVGQRTREIGVRIALGAGVRSVLGMVIRQGLQLTGVGIVLGVIAAAAGTRAMRSLLYGVDPLDPLTFVLVVAVLLAVATLAAWLPARRATRVDPVVALRSE